MTGLRHLCLAARRMAALTHPNAWLALATMVVFAFALGAGWTISSQAQSVPCAGGSNYCLWNPGQNACAEYTTCYPTGPGYTCMVTGNPNPQPEGTWKFTPTKPWATCTSPATSSTMSCTAATQSCGTTYHYVSGYSACNLLHSCVGNWYWMACWGTGDLC